MNSHNHCNVCGEGFTQTNLAWIMSMCGHNICNNCLKNCLATKAKSIACKECKKKYNVDSDMLQEFPKNITIIKNLRQSKNNSILSGDTKKQEKADSSLEGSMLLSNSSIKLTSGNCPKHGKPLQIICTVDRGLLCAHCAIFGEHQNHTFKTIEQFTSEYSTFKQSCNQILLQKHVCQQNVKGKKYRSTVISKISEKKDKLVVEVRDCFAKLSTYLKDAETKVYEELMKCFRSVDAEISKAVKEETQIDRSFENWKKQIQDYVREIQSVPDIKNKIHVYYKPEKPNLAYGQKCLKQLQKSVFSIKQSVEQKISSIKIQYNEGVDGHIFNFAKVVVDQFEIKTKPKIELQHFRQTEEPKYMKKQMKIEFVKSNQLQTDSSKLIKELPVPVKKEDVLKTSRSNINKVKSNPKLPKGVLEKQKLDIPKKNFTPPKPYSRNSEQPKHTQNLEFAERMLQQFLTSTDTLDITGCELSDEEIIHIVEAAAQQKHIKCLKICKNKLTNHGLAQLVPFLSSVTNINLSYNGLTDDCIDIFVDKRQSMSALRIINLGHNKVNERKVKTKMEELRKYGIITTL